MAKNITTVFEVLFVIAAIVIAILWVNKPSGNYEPYFSLLFFLIYCLKL